MDIVGCNWRVWVGEEDDELEKVRARVRVYNSIE